MMIVVKKTHAKGTGGNDDILSRQDILYSLLEAVDYEHPFVAELRGERVTVLGYRASNGQMKPEIKTSIGYVDCHIAGRSYIMPMWSMLNNLETELISLPEATPQQFVLLRGRYVKMEPNAKEEKIYGEGP